MKRHCRFRIGLRMVLLFVLPLSFYPVSASALDNQLWSSGFTFHFTPPGARALGMGGAFVALADDATAAVANPAGLAQLTNTQLTVDGRLITSYDKNNPFSFNSPVTGGTEKGYFNSSSNTSDIEDVSFAAFTTPLFNNFINVSIFYDRPVDYVSSTSANLNVTSTIGGSSFNQTLQFMNTANLAVDEFGVSAAKSFCNGKILVGAGMGGQILLFNRSTSQQLTPSTIPPSIAFNDQLNNDQEAGLAWRAGILAKPIDNLSLGFNASINPSFNTNVANFITSFTTVGKTIVESDYQYMTPEKFKVPDNYSFGAAYSLYPNWKWIFEARYVLYSQLTKDFQVTGYGIESPSPSNFSCDDIVELHFGTEYVINTYENLPIALRAGLFYEPAHDLKYNGSAPIETNLFNGGEDLVHYTFGAGTVICNHYQFDIGVDINREYQSVSASAVYQF